MKTPLLSLLLLGFLAASTLFAAEPTPVVAGPAFKTASPTTPEAQAQSAAKAWLALVDAGKYGASWDQSAAFFKAAAPQEQWEKLLNAFRKPLGELVSRKLKEAQSQKALPGAPDGEYVVLQFTSSFAQKKDAIETVTFLREKDGTWKAVGYFIR